jgi:hypothetical protein
MFGVDIEFMINEDFFDFVLKEYQLSFPSEEKYSII